MKESININENLQGKDSKVLEISKKSNMDVSDSSGGKEKM